MALLHVKHFLRQMAQPVDQLSLQNVLLTLQEVERMAPPPVRATAFAGEGGAMLTEENVR